MNGNTRRRQVALALIGVAGITIGTGSVAGAELVSTAAPEGEASGTALEVPGVIAIGKTSATAGSSTGEATAYAVQLGGDPPPEQLGGTQSGPGTSSGGLLDTGQTPLGRLQVAPWEATVTSTSSARTAESDAALARLDVLDPSVASVDVLQSSSDARHTGSASSGSASSDAAEVTVGDELTVRLLHADASSSGTGLSYLLGLNDTYVLSSDDVDGACVVEIPSLLQLICLDASGGLGAGAAEVVKLVVGGSGGLQADVVAASTTGGGTGPAVLPKTIVPSAPTGGGELPRALADAGTLPRTGTVAWALAVVAIAVVALGTATRLLARQRLVVGPR